MRCKGWSLFPTFIHLLWFWANPRRQELHRTGEDTEGGEMLFGSHLRFLESHEFFSRRCYNQAYVVWNDLDDFLFQHPCFFRWSIWMLLYLVPREWKNILGMESLGSKKRIAPCTLGEEEACVGLSGSIMWFLLHLLFPTRLPSVFTATPGPLVEMFSVGGGKQVPHNWNLMWYPTWRWVGGVCVGPILRNWHSLSLAEVLREDIEVICCISVPSWALGWNVWSSKRTGRGHTVRTRALEPFCKVLPGSGLQTEGWCTFILMNFFCP